MVGTDTPNFLYFEEGEIFGMEGLHTGHNEASSWPRFTTSDGHVTQIDFVYIILYNTVCNRGMRKHINTWIYKKYNILEEKSVKSQEHR